MRKHHPFIDGLRAVAIIPVLLFHLDLGAPGGFVGVDIFFVISGFLIASIVIRELEEGRFSFLRFWERRIRRILPALAVVVFASAVAGFFWMIPSHLEELGKSILAQPALAANIYFFQETGYFETSAEFKPLLQTWSLAVEEQFYLFFPLVMLLLLRNKRHSESQPHSQRRAAIVFVLVCIAGSLAWSIYSSIHYPSFGFFLTPSRIWELDLGVLLALTGTLGFKKRKLNELYSWLGLGMILVAVATFSAATPFPGYTALLPCIGTVLILGSNLANPTSLGRLLSMEPIRFVGLISYSLYLWHWPLIVFTRYHTLSELTPPQQIILALASFGIAAASWRFIEQPFRNKASSSSTRRSSRMPFVFAAGIAVLLVGTGFLFARSEGLPKRFPAEILALTDLDDDHMQLRGRDYFEEHGTMPTFGAERLKAERNILVWGDSHAIALIPILESLGKEHSVCFHLAAQPSTPPLLNVYTERIGRATIEWSESVLSYLGQDTFDGVLLHARWSLYTEPDEGGTGRNLVRSDLDSDGLGEAVFLEKLRATLVALRNHVTHISILEEIPSHKISVPEFMMLAKLRSQLIEDEEFVSRWDRSSSIFHHEAAERATGELNVQLIDPSPELVSGSGKILRFADGKILYGDSHHLSRAGAERLRDPILDWLETTL